jgi:hypothetical protein
MSQEPNKAPPSNCRQQLAADGKPYPRSSCAVCGQFSPRWKECDALLTAAPVPPADGEVEVLAVATLGSFSAEELGEIDVEPQMRTLERIQQQVVTNEDVSLELVDRAHVTRLQAENAALQQRLTVADQRIDDLEADMAKARELLEDAQDRYQYGTLGWYDISNFLAHQSAPAAAPLDPVHGDVLPPVGSTVQIKLGDSGWFDHTVTGYYAWPNHGLDKNVHRVFVRVKDAAGTQNARLLTDVRIPPPASPK